MTLTNITSIPFNKSDLESSIVNRFKHVASEVPDCVAVDVLTDRFTYAQMDVFSDQIARVITYRTALQADAPIALLIEERHLAITAILGILKSGHPAVVFPSELPLEQLSYLWNDSLHPLILTSRKTQQLTSRLASSKNDWIIIDDLASTVEDDSGEMKLPESQPGDLAMISYTSGSTGNPKGVMQSHRMLLHSAYLHQRGINFHPRDRAAVLATFGYGAAKTQIFAALLSGATVYIPNIKQMKISSLLEWLQQEQITILASPPIALLRQIMDGMSAGSRLPHIRVVTTGGEDFSRQDVERLWSCFDSQTTFHFKLTGSEIQIIREIFLHPGMEFPTDKIPVGYAVPDKEVLLLDEGGKEVPQGEIGEIVVRSRYLASGYWRQPELTAACFKPDPAGGEESTYYTGDLGRINTLGQMEHLGRKDNMVKIHGFSVHLETVDQALGKLAYVKEGVAAAFPLPGGDRRLVAYLVAGGGEKPRVGEIRRDLAQILPEHMQPSAFVWLEELPHTSTGKVDRNGVPPPPRERPDLGEKYVAPRDELEETLVEVWKDLLQLDEIGVEDNYFDLGGDSLSSVRMIIEAEKVLGFTIPKAYFEKATIANLVLLFKEWKSSEGTGSMPGAEWSHAGGSRSSVKRVTRSQAAVRKILHREWNVSDIIQRGNWIARSIKLDMNDYSIRKSILRSSYWEGIDKLSHWVSTPFVMNKLYRKRYQEFSQLLDDLGSPAEDRIITFQASIMGNIFSRLGLHYYLEKVNNDIVRMPEVARDPFWISFSKLVADTPVDKMDDIFPVSNLEYLQRAHQAGRGVILVSYHSTVNRLAVLALSRRLISERIPTISEKRARRESVHWRNNFARDLPASEFAALKAGVALEGQHLLREGRIVQFVSDNEYARQGHAVIVARRRYYLRPGFAELALNTGAAVVPMFCKMKSDGRIQMTLLPQIKVGNGDRNSRIIELLDQYAQFLNASWREAPESLRWPRLFRHFLQPLVS